MHLQRADGEAPGKSEYCGEWEIQMSMRLRKKNVKLLLDKENRDDTWGKEAGWEHRDLPWIITPQHFSMLPQLRYPLHPDV